MQHASRVLWLSKVSLVCSSTHILPLAIKFSPFAQGSAALSNIAEKDAFTLKVVNQPSVDNVTSLLLNTHIADLNFSQTKLIRYQKLKTANHKVIESKLVIFIETSISFYPLTLIEIMQNESDDLFVPCCKKIPFLILNKRVMLLNSVSVTEFILC